MPRFNIGLVSQRRRDSEMTGRLRTSSQRIPAAIILAALVIVLHAVLPASAIAEIGDISVGGIWVCQITMGAAGLTLEQRVAQINQRITDVLSLPALPRRQIDVDVRPVGGAAAIVVADITVMTVTPADSAGTHLPPARSSTPMGSTPHARAPARAPGAKCGGESVRAAVGPAPGRSAAPHRHHLAVA